MRFRPGLDCFASLAMTRGRAWLLETDTMEYGINRRDFLKAITAGGATLAFGGGLTRVPLARRLLAGEELLQGGVKEAQFYFRLKGDRVRCTLCPHACVVANRERGTCGVRENRDGTYYTLVYGNPCAVHTDPIEKKPLFHFLPGAAAFSISTAGCNFECRFCQNWSISQFRPEQVTSIDLPPGKTVLRAKREGAKVIAYTYGEPVIFYEYMCETARLGRKEGLRSVMISNGYICEEPTRKACEVLDAVKIDFKAFTDKFYREVCSGTLQPVLDTLLFLKRIGIWYELVVLLVPTLNDSASEITDMSQWIVDNLGLDVPVHFSRYYPCYKITNIPRTPVRTLERARDIGMKAGLKFVYIGNVPGQKGESTYCPKCGKLLIERLGYFVKVPGLKSGVCKYCGEKIPGVWE